MAFSDVDATAEIAKLGHQLTSLGNQLTTALVQIAEMRGELNAMRRDLDRTVMSASTAPASPVVVGWNVVLLSVMSIMLVAAILLAVYVGGGQGGF